MFLILILTYFWLIDLVFWKNKEKQLLEFYEHIDQQMGHFLFLTKSPCMDMYRRIIEIGITGKKNHYYKMTYNYYCL